MRQIVYLFFFLACVSWQCKQKQDPAPQPPGQMEIDVLDFKVPGVDQKDITIEKDLIVVHLPEKYPHGDYIKPDVVLGKGYSSQSPILNGTSYENQEIKLILESTTRQHRSFDVVVIPFKAINLNKPAENLQLTIGPEAAITTSFDLKGTRASVDEKGELVHFPFVRLTNKATGESVLNLLPMLSYSELDAETTWPLPTTTLPGEYIAEVVWGTKTEVLAAQVSIKAGPVQFKRESWRMLEGDHYFEVSGFNFSPTEKYEAIVQNDFTKPQRIDLKFAKTGTLSGSLPENIGVGNYRITYLVNGKSSAPFDKDLGILKYMGDDHFYIRKYDQQPVARIVTQLSQLSTFKTYQGFDLDYLPSINVVNRQDPVMVYTESTGAFPNKNDIVLIDINSRKEYTIGYSGNGYGLFDGFMMFLSYRITSDIPNGKYELYVVRGEQRTERYSQIITIK